MVRSRLRKIQRRPDLIDAFPGQTGLPCRLGSATNTFRTWRVSTTERPRSPRTRQPAHVSPERLDGGKSGPPSDLFRSATLGPKLPIPSAGVIRGLTGRGGALGKAEQRLN
jgi:hypothetical protein